MHGIVHDLKVYRCILFHGTTMAIITIQSNIATAASFTPSDSIQTSSLTFLIITMPVLTRSQTQLAAATQPYIRPTEGHHAIRRSEGMPVPKPLPEVTQGPETSPVHVKSEGTPSPSPATSEAASTVNIKSERTSSPELKPEPIKKKPVARKHNRIECLRKRTPPRELSRRTPSPLPQVPKGAARGHRTAESLTPIPPPLPVQQPGRRRSKIFLRLQRASAQEEFIFVPRPPILIPLRRPNDQADWEYNRDRV